MQFIYMSKFTNFVGGLIVGFIVCYHFVKKPQEIKHFQESSRSTTSVSEPSRNIATVKKEKIVKDAEVEIAQPMINEKNISSNQPEAPEVAQSYNKQITVHEEDIITMERQWNSLPHQIQVVAESDGWKIHTIDPTSPFARAGLNTGDFITKSFVENFGKNNSNPLLSRRLLNILNKVTIH